MQPATVLSAGSQHTANWQHKQLATLLPRQYCKPLIQALTYLVQPRALGNMALPNCSLLCLILIHPHFLEILCNCFPPALCSAPAFLLPSGVHLRASFATLLFSRNYGTRISCWQFWHMVEFINAHFMCNDNLSGRFLQCNQYGLDVSGIPYKHEWLTVVHWRVIGISHRAMTTYWPGYDMLCMWRDITAANLSSQTWNCRLQK
jgi:hypothetical protein